MNLSSVLLILISVSLSAIAQVTMKHGVSQPDIQKNLAEPMTALGYLATNGYVIAGLTLYVTSVAFWLFVLATLCDERRLLVVRAGAARRQRGLSLRWHRVYFDHGACCIGIGGTGWAPQSGRHTARRCWGSTGGAKLERH